MPKRVGGNGKLFRKLISDENLSLAITEVNKTHHWHHNHKPNEVSAWVELTKEDRIKDLRKIITEGFVQHEPHVTQRWDNAAQKYRTICEPIQWPDQYVHHALVQVLQPVFMRSMDFYCCGSIRGRGAEHERRTIAGWMRKDPKKTKYCLMCDVRKFYDSLDPGLVMVRLQRLIKDKRILNLAWRIIKDGVRIGFYTSQWFANVYLQPLDMLIRQSGYCKYYARYMDNFTIFGPNKRKLKKLRMAIDQWLQAHGLTLKDNWAVFLVGGEPDKQRLDEPRRGVMRSKHRLPDAVGYRYGRGYVLPRKNNFLRLKRQVAKYRKKKKQGKEITFEFAAGLLSRLGQLKHCNNTNLYAYLFHGERIQRELKDIVRKHYKEARLEWSTYLEQVKATKQF